VSANSLVKTRDFRLEFQNTAWDTKHTHATWAAGARSLDNNELLQVTYYALVPNLPPAIPPIIDPPVNPYSLAPVPDTVTEQSDFSGRGAGASLDVEFKLAPRISIVSGLSIGLLRGKTTTYFQSNTSYYYQSFGTPHYLSKEELFAILDSGDPSEIRGITQVPVVNALSVPSTSQAAQTYEIYVGLQSRIWRGLQVFATYRELYYQNVGARAVLTADGTVDTTPVSIGYDGYLLGLSWRF